MGFLSSFLWFIRYWWVCLKKGFLWEISSKGFNGKNSLKQFFFCGVPYGLGDCLTSHSLFARCYLMGRLFSLPRTLSFVVTLLIYSIDPGGNPIFQCHYISDLDTEINAFWCLKFWLDDKFIEIVTAWIYMYILCPFETFLFFKRSGS